MKLQNSISFLFIVAISQLTLTPSIHAQIPYSIIEFETRDSIPQLLADSTTGDWQIGIPQKDFFGEAHSQPFAIMTDTIEEFTSDTVSSFIVSFSNTSEDGNYQFYSASICFQHKLQAEYGVDFAQVAISANNGVFWSDFTNDQGGYELAFGGGGIEYSSDFYNDWYFDGNDSLYGFTGEFEEYRETCLNICWYWPIIVGSGTETYPPDSIWLKFTFIAGTNSTGNAGWIIDDISIDYYDCGSSVSEYYLPPLEVYPQPARETLSFIKPENTSSQAVLSIYNSIGQTVKQIPYKGDKLSIDIQNWNWGIYTYVLRDNGVAINVGKLIVGH